MRYVIRRPRMAVFAILAAVFTTVVVAVVLLMGFTAQASTCSGVHIKPGDDLDAIVNRDPKDRATTFCVHASSSGTTYNINHSVILYAGDRLIGDSGQVVTRGPASYGVPKVKIRDAASVDKLIQMRGTSQIKWVDISGGEDGIAAYYAGPKSVIEYVTIHGNSRTGITSMNGKLLHSNLYNNGTDKSLWAHTAAAVKGVDEYEAAFNYIHDNGPEGLWCDHRCSDAGSAMPNGFWVHDNLIVNNGRWGVRYEYSPIVASGVRSSAPTALIEDNEIHGNGYGTNSGYGGASMHDAQNATFRNNSFGAKTIAGVSYRANANKRAIFFWDSGKSSRTDLWNGEARDNKLNGETMKGCDRPDNIVYCANNG
jgi:hypothetical protein